MRTLYVVTAISVGSIVGLITYGVAPAGKTLYGVLALLLTTGIVLLGGSIGPPEEDSEPEIRAPEYRSDDDGDT